MNAHRTDARSHPIPWIVLLAALALSVMPFADPRPGFHAWSCFIAGTLFGFGALVVLWLNPTWGLVVEGRTLRWWHDGRGEHRTVSVDDLQAVHVDAEADVAELQATTGLLTIPRDCLKGPAHTWATALHQRFPHIELRVQ